ncbi:ArsC family reductase [Pantoea sp.]|uniref:ArsC family reductase n=1 Tax=Pantoea sp. TaxID=69393 RepID=UPI00289D26DB|nr:ArsC family reductase [Pantoea sp.]
MTAQWVMYGIKNCDTIKKARRYLDDAGVDYRFHDYRSEGVSDALLQGFIDLLGWQDLLNTRGTTWRKLPQEARDSINDAASAKQIMLAQPSIIKRPLLCAPDGSMLLGFSESAWHTFLQEKS